MSSPRSAFTLIELLLVVLVLGIAAAIAAPRVAALLPQAQLRGAARQVVDAIRLAQAYAVNQGSPAYVEYHLAGRTLQLVPQGPYAGEPPRLEPLPAGVFIGAVRLPGRPVVDHGEVRLPVSPSGYVHPHQVELRAAEGGRILVNVAGLAAYVPEG